MDEKIDELLNLTKKLLDQSVDIVHESLSPITLHLKTFGKLTNNY